MIATVANDSHQTSDSLFLFVLARKPIIHSLSVNPTSVCPESSATVTVVASDPNADPLTYTYIATGGNLSGSSSSITWTAPIGSGSYGITSIVSDGRFSDTAFITVQVSDILSVQSVTATPPSVFPGDSSLITVHGNVPCGAIPQYSYSCTGGSIFGDSATAIWHAPDNPGNFTVFVDVTADGQYASRSVTIQVSQRPARIMGTLVLPSSDVGNLTGIKVSVYTSINNWAHNLFLKSVVASGSGSSATYVIDSLPSGTYYLDAWQDNNANALIDDGDLFGWCGTGEYPVGSLTAINLVAYEWKTINVNVSSYGNNLATKQK